MAQQTENSLIIRDFATDKVSLSKAFPELRDNALAGAALIGKVNSPATNESATEALRNIKILIRDVEKARKTVKDPVLELCRAIDKAAGDAVTELKAEELRLNTLQGNYAQEQLNAAREAERKRQAELDRIERERREAEYQARRQAEEEERQRQAAERKAREEREAAERKAQEAAKAANDAKTSAARRKAQEEAAAAQAEAEKARIKAAQEEERINRERQEAAEAQEQTELAIAERSAQAQEAIGGPCLPQTAKGQTIKATYDFEVVDVWLLTRTNPGFVKPEPLRAEILRAINEGGVKEIKGVRIFEKVKNQINTRGQSAIIDV